MNRPRAFIVAAALALGGCADPITIDFDVQSSPPVTASFRYDDITLAEGLAVVVRANPIDDSHERLDWETLLELEAVDPRVLEVTRLEYPERDEREGDDRDFGDWYFTFAAVSIGTTALEYYVDGELEGDIAVHVVPQPEE
jgi:hypothetical protein